MGDIADSLSKVDDPKARSGLKAQAIIDRLAALPANRRATYSLKGYTVQLLSNPVPLQDKQGRTVGISVRARARDTSGQLLPSGDFIHQIVNPPVYVPDGGVDVDGSRTYTEDAVAALQNWLLDSIIADAVKQGYKV